ncbi:MAG TPA: DUF488 domain-containing protein [Blastocatellia bacterium]|nr:DUF488 domain-containing protein [Blastocatellia bacterium]
MRPRTRNFATPARGCFNAMTVVNTIGFTKKTLRDFIGLLKSAQVGTLVDVRLRNTSQLAGWSKYPDFAYLLEEGFGIRYEHHPALAPTAELLDQYKKDLDWAKYDMNFTRLLAARNPEAECLTLLSRGTICLLCTEATAERCHRRIVAEYIAAISPGVEIKHL